MITIEDGRRLRADFTKLREPILRFSTPFLSLDFISSLLHREADGEHVARIGDCIAGEQPELHRIGNLFCSMGASKSITRPASERSFRQFVSNWSKAPIE